MPLEASRGVVASILYISNYLPAKLLVVVFCVVVVVLAEVISSFPSISLSDGLTLAI